MSPLLTQICSLATLKNPVVSVLISPKMVPFHTRKSKQKNEPFELNNHITGRGNALAVIIVYALARIIVINHNSLTGKSRPVALYSSFC